jgi:ribosomal protein S12 methylthiotransferase accessory factor
MTAQLEAALGRARILVDDRFGVVRQVVVHQVGPSDPPFFFATAQLASTRPFSDALASTFNGGAGLDRASAMMGALGEAIERYAIGVYRESELIRGSFDELHAVAVDPRRLVFFADEQYAWPDFPYVRYEPATSISWARGRSLLDGRERLVPAARVFTPYRAPRPTERLVQSTSTGAACHVDRERATLAALYECIERDAVMIAWLNRLPLPALDAARVEAPRVRAAVRRCAGAALDVRLLDATSDLGVPTVVSIVASPAGTVPALAVGAATRATLEEAAEKALVESAHTLFWIHTRARDRGLPVFREDYRDVVSLDLHSMLYGHPHMRAKLAFLFEAPPAAARAFKMGVHARGRRIERASGAELAGTVATLRRAGLDAIAIDVTPPDVQDLGFVVMRVVVADLHPLWGGHHVRCLGGARLREVPARTGYGDRAWTIADFNRDPHPMP